jgi:hypothetical protein
MRWRLELDGKFLRYVDADVIRENRIRGWEFVANGAVVFTISRSAVGYVSVSPVATIRLAGGPRDGQVAAAPDGEMPFNVYFLPVVPLDGEGRALAPVPPARLPELAEVYLHLPSRCPCYEHRRGVFEHVYVWSRQEDSGG